MNARGLNLVHQRAHQTTRHVEDGDGHTLAGPDGVCDRRVRERIGDGVVDLEGVAAVPAPVT